MIPKPALTPGLSLYYYISHLCYTYHSLPIQIHIPPNSRVGIGGGWLSLPCDEGIHTYNTHNTFDVAAKGASGLIFI